MTEKQEVQIWKPSEFKGADLLPAVMPKVNSIGRECIEAADLIFPVLKVLQGSSEEVKKGVEGARPGLFWLTGIQEAFNPPIRVLICAYTKSRVLFPKSDKPEFAGLEMCQSPNGKHGSIYGECATCEHKDWDNVNKKPPKCSESHNFTVLTPMGPAIIRFARTSTKTAKNFLTAWRMSPDPVFAHPAVISTYTRTDKIDGRENTTHVMEMRWIKSETVPPHAQEAARAVYEQVTAAHAQGRFDTAAEEKVEDDNPY